MENKFNDLTHVHSPNTNGLISVKKNKTVTYYIYYALFTSFIVFLELPKVLKEEEV